MKKVLVTTLSAIMVMAMSVAAFADDSTSTDSIVIEKNLKTINVALTSVDGPGATFSYAIAPETPSASNGGTTITDGTNTGTVHAGPTGGVTLPEESISFPIGITVNASASGADNTKSITATGDISQFTAPGIYRYKLTETSTTVAELNKTGDGNRYIDVYVVNGTSGLEFSGFVMHDGTTSEGQKTTFDAAEFETVNVTLTKDVQGNMGDTKNQFPFTAAISDNGRFHYAKKATAPTASDSTSTATSESTTLADSEIYYISGLAKNAKVAYEEKNNTEDVYQTSITGGTASAASAVAAGATKAMAETDVDDAAAVTFVNTLESVSPTGVVLRFGAPLLVLAAAAALVLLNKKAKTE